jgi:hypothetical protein
MVKFVVRSVDNRRVRFLIVATICTAFAPSLEGGHLPIILPAFVFIPMWIFSQISFDWLMVWPAIITFIVVAGFGFVPETGSPIIGLSKWPNSTDKE